MALSQKNLDAMVSAYGQGVLSVMADGERLEYRSIVDLERAISMCARALGVPNPLTPATTSAGRGPVRIVSITGAKGY